MIKIKDIAKATGYSITTVSKAFNGYKDISNEAKETILKAADEMGYIPNATARGLATNKSFMIGVIFDEVLGIGIRHPFFGVVIEYFKEEVEKQGYDLVFISDSIGDAKNKSYLDHCKRRGVDGIFIACANFDNSLVEELVQSDIPSITVENNGDGINAVNSDDYQGQIDAVEYLYHKGHRKIGYIKGSEMTYAGKARLAGFKQAMKKLGLDQNIDAYIQDGEMFTFEAGYEAGKAFMAMKDRPTAIAASSDLLALGAMKYIKEMGYVIPKDISIIGYDNIDFLSYMDTELTTVAQNVEVLGRRAADTLIDNMNNPELSKKEIYIPTKIIERKSVADIN